VAVTPPDQEWRAGYRLIHRNQAEYEGREWARTLAEVFHGHSAFIDGAACQVVARLVVVTVTLDLPDDVMDRLRAEADRRGITVDALVAELATALTDADPLEAFIGCGASGAAESFDLARERRRLATAKSAAGLEKL